MLSPSGATARGGLCFSGSTPLNLERITVALDIAQGRGSCPLLKAEGVNLRADLHWQFSELLPCDFFHCSGVERVHYARMHLTR